MAKCSEVPYLDDFGVRLGSLNDTNNENWNDYETKNYVFRGPNEREIHKANPMFFKIPFESYLING